MPRQSALFLTLGILALIGTGCTHVDPDTPPSTRPNIVLLLADDMGYGDPGSYNPDSKIPTPHLDRLATEGMRFTDAHSPSGVCTPTRYGLMTGRYAWRTRLTKGVLWGYSPNLIDTTRMTIASMLQQAGYATGGVGKWHLGLGEADSIDYAEPLRPGPVDHGFDYYYGIPASLDMDPYLYFENDRAVVPPTDSIGDSRPCCIGPFWRGGPIAPGFKHLDVQPVITEKAVAFIEDKASAAQPFFLYVPLAAPHTPWLPTEAFQGTSQAGEYGDFTAQVDADIGQIMETLDRLNLTGNTLLIVTSDNGAYWTAQEIDQYDHRANFTWRGMKADIWEGGHRVPFIARWPNYIAAGTTSDEVLSLIDLMATFAAVAGVALPEDAGEDSHNMLPVLRGEALEAPLREGTVFHSSEGMFAIRQGPWKLIEGRGSGGFTAPRHVEPGPGEPTGQLYHLTDDPAETTNLYQRHPDVVHQLSALLDAYRQQGFSRPMD